MGPIWAMPRRRLLEGSADPAWLAAVLWAEQWLAPQWTRERAARAGVGASPLPLEAAPLALLALTYLTHPTLAALERVRLLERPDLAAVLEQNLEEAGHRGSHVARAWRYVSVTDGDACALGTSVARLWRLSCTEQ